MSNIRNPWLRGLLKSMFITALVLVPSMMMGKFEALELISIVVAMLLVGTLVFGIIDKYYPAQSKKEK